jgi:diguanylate cyclase (GGDEF)-like protein
MEDRDLEAITSATFSELMTLNIVLPSLYEEVFLGNAEERKIDVSELLEASREDMYEFTFKDINKISEQTEQNTKILQKNISEAKDAIRDKDMVKLSKVQEDMDLLEQKMAVLREELHTDDLTNIYNRRWLFEIYLKNDAFVNHGAISLVFIKNYQALVDAYGYSISDKVLIYIANLLKKIHLASVVRFSEDKFLVLTKEPIDELYKNLKNIDAFLDNKSLKVKDIMFKVILDSTTEEFSKGEIFKTILERIDRKRLEALNS